MKKIKATVASGHPVVSRAALEIMAQGGNAYDAVVGAGFAGAVAEPALTSLGGGGFILARSRKGEELLFDFFCDTPGKGKDQEALEPHFFPVTVHFPGCDQIFNIGLGSVAVPGNLKGFLHVHQRLGRLELRRVLAPAIKAARHGVEMNHHQSYFLNLLKPIMTMEESGRTLFTPNGRSLETGERFRNPDLANFLEQLEANGPDSLYSGSLAEQIAQDMEKKQGLLTGEDLRSFAVVERQPLAIDYRGRRLLTNPPPSFGGSLITMALRILEQLDLHDLRWGSPEHVSALASVLIEVEDLREKYGFSTEEIDQQWFQQTGERIRTFSRGTTHVSVVDAEGNAASMTTSNGEGSGYIVPGSGIMLNNMMGEDDLHPLGFHASPAGERISSMMSPTIIMQGEQPELVVGSGGSKRIRTAITQVISNIIDFSMEIGQAVEAPRIHWDEDTLQVEPGYSSEAITRLQGNWKVNLWQEKNIYFGGAHAVAPGLGGAGDSRRGGHSQSL